MASHQYMRYIEPETPEEKHELTKKEKASNFWYYYKWHILVGIIAIVLVAVFIKDIASSKKPDYQIAILTSTTLPDDVLSNLETALTPYIDDRNGDGTVYFSVVQYNMAVNQSEEDTKLDATDANSDSTEVYAEAGGSTVDAYGQMAGVTKLMSDAQTGDSMLFLTDDVLGFQTTNEMFAYNDSSAPVEGEEIKLENMGVSWNDTLFANMDFDDVVFFDGSTATMNSIMSDFYLVKRIFEDTAISDKENLREYYNLSCDLFTQLTTK